MHPLWFWLSIQLNCFFYGYFYLRETMSSRSETIWVTNRVVSMVHALLTSLTAVWWLYQTGSEFSYTDPTTPWQMEIMYFSMSYFIVDLAYLVIVEWSLVYVVHHLCCLLVWWYILVLGRYGSLALFGLFWGETTNPVVLWWSLSKRFGRQNLAKWLFRLMLFMFIPIRSVIIPVISVRAMSEIWASEHGIITPMVMILSIVILVLGGIWWSYRLIRLAYRTGEISQWVYRCQTRLSNIYSRESP